MTTFRPRNTYGLPPVEAIWKPTKQARPQQPKRVTAPFLELPPSSSQQGVASYLLAPRAQPLTPWTGGKRVFFSQLLGKFPDNISGHFVVPFAGMLSVTLELYNQRRFAPGTQITIADVNTPLMGLFWLLRDAQGLGALMDHLSANASTDYRNEAESYYRVRDRFNEEGWYDTEAPQRLAANPCEYLQGFADFYYLMKYGHGGMHRVSKTGKFTIPFGRRGFKEGKPHYHVPLFSPERFLAVHAALQGARLAISPFESTLATIDTETPTFLWLDPPYIGTELTYMGGFPSTAHWKLAWILRHLHAQGNVKFLLTNHDTDVSRKLYSYPHFTLQSLWVRRALAAMSDRGGTTGKQKRPIQKKAAELIVTNY